MRKSNMTFSLLCLLIYLIPADLQAEQDDIDWQHLMLGDILIVKIDNEQGIPGLRASFTVRASRMEIWEMLTEYDQFKTIYSGIDSLNVISEDENGAVVEFFQTTLFKRINYVLRRNYIKPGYNLTWECISGDMEYIRGSWDILDSPEDGTMLAIYTNFYKHGGIIPTRITRIWAMKQVRNMAENARARIRENRSKQQDPVI
jgi:hypothetical protein